MRRKAKAEAEYEEGAVSSLTAHEDWRPKWAVLQRRSRDRWGEQIQDDNKAVATVLAAMARQGLPAPAAHRALPPAPDDPNIIDVEAVEIPDTTPATSEHADAGS